MKIIKNLEKFNNKNKNVIAIGNFDGIHLGHKKVLTQAYKKAKKNNLKFGVVTFEPMPVMFFNNKVKNHRINNLRQKISGMKNLKVDFLIIIKFNKKFSNINYKQFIKKIIFSKLKSKYIFVSKNFKFGKKREGNIKKLKENESYFSYKTCIAKPFKKHNKILSSSIIRSEIGKGNLEKVNYFLGRNWCVEGKVIKGEQRGRKIGFPTCNIKLNDYALPKLGVYSVEVSIDKLKRKGIANVGYRPTFKEKTLLLEVNIFDLKSNLYNKRLKISFLKFIRPERRFNNINQLKKQITKDVLQAKNLND